MQDTIKSIFHTKHFRMVLILFILSRLILTFTGLYSRHFLQHRFEGWYEWTYSKYTVFDIWSVWDSGWYLDIAQNGYSTKLLSDLPKKTSPGQVNLVFYPLYPFSIRIIGNVINDFHLAGVLISNVSFLVSSVFFFKLVKDKYNEKVANRSLLFLYLFPTSFFFSALLTEGVFFLWVILAFYFSNKNMWKLSCVFAFLASLTRSVGFLLIIPLLLQFISSQKEKISITNKKQYYFLIILLGPVIYMAFIYHLTGNPFYVFSVEAQGWNHKFINPVKYLYTSIPHINSFLVYFGALFITQISLVVKYMKKLSITFLSFSLIYLLLPFSSGGETILAMPRFASIVFPVYISLAFYTNSQIKIFLLSLVLISLQIISFSFWSLGVFGY